jgi:hypothetical protein
MSIDPDRRAALVAAKLRAVVRGRWPEVAADAPTGSFPSGATLHDPASGRLWVLVEGDATRRLGGALALADRLGVDELHLVVDDADGPAGPAVLARRAGLFTRPPAVWALRGTGLEAVDAAPPATDAAPDPRAELYRPVLVAAGLTPVVEGGHLIGELRGLEVARVVVDDERGARVEAGVGRFDREVASMMFAELGETDALARAVELVDTYRRPGAERHPLNQLVPERWLRAALLADPSLVGAAELRPVGSAVPRANLLEPGVATAIGTDTAGATVVVTCSAGVDLEAVPSAADDRLAHAPDARLIVAVPARNALPVTTALAAHLVRPAEVVAVPDGWDAEASGEASGEAS